eukprot:c28240_g1_i1 orf=198-470(-)
MTQLFQLRCLSLCQRKVVLQTKQAPVSNACNDHSDRRKDQEQSTDIKRAANSRWRNLFQSHPKAQWEAPRSFYAHHETCTAKPTHVKLQS